VRGKYIVGAIKHTAHDESLLRLAAQRIVRSMVQWGVLNDSEKRGNYIGSLQSITAQGELAELLLEGILINQGKALTIDQTIQHPAFFPFDKRYVCSICLTTDGSY